MSVSEENAPEEIVKQTVERFGKLDILVNAAGITRRVMAIDIDRKDWQDVLDVNLTALFFMCQAAGPASSSSRAEAERSSTSAP